MALAPRWQVLRREMRRRRTQQRLGAMFTGLLLSFASLAAEGPYSADFWQYLVEYADEQGHFFDPLDYAASAAIPNTAHADYERNRQPSASGQEADQSSAHGEGVTQERTQ